jgi:hypothetical protein
MLRTQRFVASTSQDTLLMWFGSWREVDSHRRTQDGGRGSSKLARWLQRCTSQCHIGDREARTPWSLVGLAGSMVSLLIGLVRGIRR